MVRAHGGDDEKVALGPPFGDLAQIRGAVFGNVDDGRQRGSDDGRLTLGVERGPQFRDDGRDTLADDLVSAVRIGASIGLVLLQ
jgi:hypothetical protein